MTERSPSPIAAAVGLAAVTAEGVRKLPGLLAGLPPAVVRELAEARDAARHRYDELALHGKDVLAGRQVARPGGSPAPAGAVPTAAPWTITREDPEDIDVVDVLDDVAESPVAGTAVVEPVTAPPAESPVAGTAVVEPVTAPPAETPPPGLSEPVTLPEDVLEDVAQLTPGDELAHADLPLEDFDHQTVPQLRGRLRTLELPELIQLRDYEQAHGARLPVLTLLDNRIAKLVAQPES
jgi:hypothetical protein